MTLAATWRAARPEPAVLHLDSAAASRSSVAVLDAVTAHLQLEATTGGYVAAAQAGPALERLAGDLGTLLGRAPADVALVESAVAALEVLLGALDLPRGATVLVTPGEYGPNLARYAAHGLRVEAAAVTDAHGHLDLDALGTRLATDPPAVVHLCHLGSHRGVVQPVAAAVALCRSAGVLVVVDAAQALGHVDCTHDADAVYATSRKWLAGPRGVGVLAVRPSLGLDVAALQSSEAFVAGRLGLGVAVAQHLAAGPEQVRGRLREVGALTRAALDGVAGWSVVEPVDEPSATTTLRPPAGWDDTAVAVAHARLLAEHRVVVTLADAWRAPLEMTSTVLRVSPHVDVTPDELGRLAGALAAVS